MSASLYGNMRGPQVKTTLLLLLLLTSLTGTVFCTEEEATDEDASETEEAANEQDPSPTLDPSTVEGDPTGTAVLVTFNFCVEVEGDSGDLSSTSEPSAVEGDPTETVEDTEGEADSGDTEEVSDQEEGNSGNSETTEATREGRHFDNFQDTALQSSPTADSPPKSEDVTEDSDSGVYDPEESTDAPNEEDGSGLIIIIIAVVAVVIVVAIVGGILFYRQRNKKLINQELSKEDPYLEGSSTEKVPMPMFEEDVPSVQELEMEELGQWMKKDDSSTAS